MRVLKHILALILGFGLTILVAILIAYSQEVLSRSRKYDERPFDSAAWRNEERVNQRFQMLKDLQYYYLSDGMSIKKVVELLGEPDLRKGDSIVSYNIGSSGLLSFDQRLIFKITDTTVTDFYIE